MREVVNSLVRREGGILSDQFDPYLRDVYDHVVRTTEFIETYRDLLSGALDIYLSAVANRTNQVMKVLTDLGHHRAAHGDYYRLLRHEPAAALA